MTAYLFILALTSLYTGVVWALMYKIGQQQTAQRLSMQDIEAAICGGKK